VAVGTTGGGPRADAVRPTPSAGYPHAMTGPDDRRAEARDDADDDALDATDVDPTGNALRNDPVERVEDALAQQQDDRGSR